MIVYAFLSVEITLLAISVENGLILCFFLLLLFAHCFGVHWRSNDLAVPVLLACVCQLTRPIEFIVFLVSAMP